MAFHKIDMETWPRREHYHYYKNIVKTSYTLTALIDITHLYGTYHRLNLRFYPTFIYCIARAVNTQKELRMAYDSDGNLGYYDICHPSYTIFHEDDHTFSDIWTPYHKDFSIFYGNCIHDMELYKDVKGIKAKDNKPKNFTPISCLPWLSYSGHANDTPGSGPMLFPVILFGRYTKNAGGRVTIPLSIYLCHAVADGYHASMFFKDVSDMAERCSEWCHITKL